MTFSPIFAVVSRQRMPTHKSIVALTIAAQYAHSEWIGAGDNGVDDAGGGCHEYVAGSDLLGFKRLMADDATAAERHVEIFANMCAVFDDAIGV